jgi:hypothetical protein
MKHMGSAHDELELEALLLRHASNWPQSAGPRPGPGRRGPGPLQIVSSRMGLLWDSLSSAYDALGFNRAAGGDEVFRPAFIARLSNSGPGSGVFESSRRRG